MTSEEKIDLLQKLEEEPRLSKEQFAVLHELAADKDTLVRSTVAATLANCEQEEARHILQRLAQDPEELVRIEALDSLAAFPVPEVADLLEHAAQNEPSELARRYAILAWAEVLLPLDGATEEKKSVARRAKAVETAPSCQAGWCYALFRLGEESVFEELLAFLQHEEYHTRSMLLDLLPDCVTDENYARICESVTKLLETEPLPWLKERAERCLAIL